MEYIIKAMGAITADCEQLFSRGDLSVREREELFAKLINANHALLSAAGMSCQELDKVKYECSSVVNLACKLTGAGGGGCALCFKPTFNANIEKEIDGLINELEALGVHCFETKLGVVGVQARKSLTSLDWFQNADLPFLRRSLM